MKYLDEASGMLFTASEIMTQMKLEEFEGQFDDYILEKGYTQYEEEKIEEEEESDFQSDVVVNSAIAASENIIESAVDVDPAKKLTKIQKDYKKRFSGLNLGNISLESIDVPQTNEEIKKAEKYNAVNTATKNFKEYNKNYTFGFGEGPGTDFNKSNFGSGAQGSYLKNKELKQIMDDEIRALGPDFNYPETLYELTESKFVDAFRLEFPAINIKEVDVGDGVEIYYNGKTEYLDLQRFLPGKKHFDNFNRVIKEIKQFDKEQTAEEMLSSITSGLIFSFGEKEVDANYVNKVLDGTGYSINYSRGAYDEFSSKGDGDKVELFYNGEVVVGGIDEYGKELPFYDNTNLIQEYLYNNLTPIQNAVVAKKSYELLDAFLLKRAKEKAEVSDSLNEQEVKEAYATTDFISNVNAIADEAGLTTEQKNILKNYLQDQQNKAYEMQPIEGGKYIDDFEMYYNYDTATNLLGLDEDILSALQTNGIVEQLNELGLTTTKKRLVEEKMLTIAEALMASENQDLLQLAQRYQYASKEKAEDLILEKIGIAQRSTSNIAKLIEYKTVELLANMPDEVTLSTTQITTPDGVPYTEFGLQVKGELNLEGEDLKAYNAAALEWWTLQGNVNRLEDDRRKFIQNLITDINGFESLDEIAIVKDDNGNEFEVNKNIHDLVFKEYDGIDLIKNDLNNGFKQILLTVPTLLGSDAALDAQREINEDSQFFQSMVSYDDTKGQGGLYALRTFAQQFPNQAPVSKLIYHLQL